MAHPNSKALFGGGPWPTNCVELFKSADHCLAFMFGRPDHDAHVRRWRSHQWVVSERALNKLRFAAVDAWIVEERARRLARIEAEKPLMQAECDRANREFEDRRALRLAERESMS